MRRLWSFIGKVYFVFLFVLFEVIAYNMYSSNSMYINARVHNASNEMLGGVYDIKRSISDYFTLKQTNTLLLDENARLSNRLSALEDINLRLIYGDAVVVKADSMPSLEMDSLMLMRTDTDTVRIDSVLVAAPNLVAEHFVVAKVIKNMVSRQRNFITLNKGERDSVKLNYPVVCDGAIVGYVVSVSPNYSIVMSVLNIGFKTSGMLKNDGAICSISWRGEGVDEIGFSGISSHAKIQVGDTVTTTGFSSFFTANKVIGIVKDFELKENMYYNGTLKLAAPLSKLRYVHIIIPDRLDERLDIEGSVEQNEQ